MQYTETETWVRCRAIVRLHHDPGDLTPAEVLRINGWRLFDLYERLPAERCDKAFRDIEDAGVPTRRCLMQSGHLAWEEAQA
ncbi:MAG: hypothetical protein AAF328_00385 [Planctomycetota bacterium]